MIGEGVLYPIKLYLDYEDHGGVSFYLWWYRHYFFVNIDIQSLSKNRLINKITSLYNPGNIVTVFTVKENSDNGKSPFVDACILVLFGSIASCSLPRLFNWGKIAECVLNK